MSHRNTISNHQRGKNSLKQINHIFCCSCWEVGKTKKYHTIGTDPNSNRKIVERGKIDTLNTNTGPFTLLAYYMHFNKKWRS